MWGTCGAHWGTAHWGTLGLAGAYRRPIGPHIGTHCPPLGTHRAPLGLIGTHIWDSLGSQPQPGHLHVGAVRVERPLRQSMGVEGGRRVPIKLEGDPRVRTLLAQPAKVAVHLGGEAPNEESTDGADARARASERALEARQGGDARFGVGCVPKMRARRVLTAGRRGPEHCECTAPEQYTRALHQSSAPEQCTRAVHQSSAPEQRTRAVHQSSAPEQCTRAVHQSSAPEHYTSTIRARTLRRSPMNPL